MDGPMRAEGPGSSRMQDLAVTIKKVANGYIVDASVNGNVGYNYESKHDGSYWRNEYFYGRADTRVFSTIEEAYKEAEPMMKEAEKNLAESIANFKKAMKLK